MKWKPLRIGRLVAEKPVIQGGMGVGVSLSSLAGAVAAQGGGVISTAQIGYREPDYDVHPLEAGGAGCREKAVYAKGKENTAKRKKQSDEQRSLNCFFFA